MPLTREKKGDTDQVTARLFDRLNKNPAGPITDEELSALCGNESGDVSEEIIRTLYEAAKPTNPKELAHFLERFDLWIERHRTNKEVNRSKK